MMTPEQKQLKYVDLVARHSSKAVPDRFQVGDELEWIDWWLGMGTNFGEFVIVRGNVYRIDDEGDAGICYVIGVNGIRSAEGAIDEAYSQHPITKQSKGEIFPMVSRLKDTLQSGFVGLNRE